MIRRELKYIVIALVMVVSFFPTISARGYRVADVQNVQIADRTRFVSNPDGILSAAAQASLDSLCYSLKERGIAEVAIVAVKDIEPRDMVTFSQELFEKWGVGDDKLDNGLGVLFVEDMREIRFHTGYGVEGVLTDAMCRRLQQEYMVPHFRDGDYSEGMVEGMMAVERLLTEGELPVAEDDDKEAMLLALAWVIVVLILPITALVIYEYRRTRCPHCKRHKLMVIKSEKMHLSTGVVLIVETLKCANCQKEHIRQRRDNNPTGGGGGILFFPSGGGSNGGGFGGGGFGGGFGGGSFGGGGGGSSW
ncbi:MAG: TPM domain-containing protein [Alistipes sp.]|nr:TPM domain-containing protein [Alistipes sp.]MBQ5924165.1 TPM domain-containing protein [Alistipes sp.]